MFRAQFVLASPWCRLFPVAVLAAFSLLHAQENPSEMLQVLSVSPDSVKVQDSAQVAPVAESDSSANQVVADSTSAQDTVAVQAPADSAVNAASVSKPLKSVLYLGGGENSPWFHLGVLYAIETYSVPVDSVVGTSWGAYIGALWAKGVAPDDIQRILLDSDMDSLAIFGTDDASAGNERFAIPVSEKGIPSLRQRFSVHVDSSGVLHRRLKMLKPDTSSIESALAVLRLQESILRHKEGYNIPFAVLGCDSVALEQCRPGIQSRPGASEQLAPQDIEYPEAPATCELHLCHMPRLMHGELGNPVQRFGCQRLRPREQVHPPRRPYHGPVGLGRVGVEDDGHRPAVPGVRLIAYAPADRLKGSLQREPVTECQRIVPRRIYQAEMIGRNGKPLHPSRVGPGREELRPCDCRRKEKEKYGSDPFHPLGKSNKNQ